MTESRRFSVLAAITCCLVVLSLAGCAPKETLKNRSDEDVLRERVMAYWNFRIKGEYDKSYYYEDPFFRKKVGLVDYIQHTGKAIKTKSVKIENVKIVGDNAEVELMTTIRVNVPDKELSRALLPRTLTDRWVSADGIWYHVEPKKGLRN